MTDVAFFDTNVFLYADDARDPLKQAKAVELVTAHQLDRTLVISLQVLQEYYNGATRKLGVDSALAQQKVEIMSRNMVMRFTEQDVIASIEFHRLNQVSFWDAMIVHAARQSGASVLYSEDLQHGSVLGGVRVVNPFI